MSSVEAELNNTEQVVLHAMQRATQEALQGLTKELPSEVITSDMDRQEIKCLEKWARKMYLHFPKETASLIIDFVDEVHGGTYQIVKKMVDQTVYNAIATHLHVTMTLSGLRRLCPQTVDEHVREKAGQILLTLYQQNDKVNSIALQHVKVALDRAAELTRLYLQKRKTDLLAGKLQKVRCASELATQLNQFHQNSMNYFYRQASNLLEQECVTAKMKVQEVYPWAYRHLLENKAFRKEMKTWLQTEIFPDVQHMKLDSSSSAPPPPQAVRAPHNNGMACF